MALIGGWLALRRHRAAPWNYCGRDHFRRLAHLSHPRSEALRRVDRDGPPHGHAFSLAPLQLGDPIPFAGRGHQIWRRWPRWLCLRARGRGGPFMHNCKAIAMRRVAQRAALAYCYLPNACGRGETVDARDLKSLGRKAVRVQVPPSAPSARFGSVSQISHISKHSGNLVGCYIETIHLRARCSPSAFRHLSRHRTWECADQKVQVEGRQ